MMTQRRNDQGRAYGKSHPEWPVIEFTQDYRRGQVFFQKRQWVSMTPDLATIFCAAGVAKVLGDVFGEVEKLSFSQCEVAYPGMLRKLGLQQSAYTHEDHEIGIQPHEFVKDHHVPQHNDEERRRPDGPNPGSRAAAPVDTMCTVCGSEILAGEGWIGLRQHGDVYKCIAFLKGALAETASRLATITNSWEYKIVSHKHLDGRCVEHGCQSVVLENAIRNQCADNLCWITDPAQAQALPEAEFLESCRRYRHQIADECGEFDEGRTIAQLEAIVLKYRTALSFYANPKNWSGMTSTSAPLVLTGLPRGPHNTGYFQAQEALVAE